MWRVLTCSLTLASPAAAFAQRPGALPPFPLTQLDDRAVSAELDTRTLTLTFGQPVPVRELLVQIVRGTSLSMVPDPSITGSFIGELKSVTVRQALDLVLPPLGLDYTVDGRFVSVFRQQPETRLFDINYVAAKRSGISRIGTGPSGDGEPRAAARSSAHVSVEATMDLYTEIERAVRSLISGGATFSLDRTAALLQVTDLPDRLERVGIYLDAVHDRVHRQVQIDGLLVEVELKDPARPLTAASGLRIADLQQFLAALEAEGAVRIVAEPRVLVLNNEPAVVRAGNTLDRERDGDGASSQEVTLTVLPHVGSDGVVTLNLSPIFTVSGGEHGAGRHSVAFGETDTLARVASGDTIVVSGSTRDYDVRERRADSARGGWFGRSTVVVTRKRAQLLMLLTPKVLD